ncbi:MAG: acetylglutamate kinase [Candidatus Omnitrophota bacterium]
MKRAIAKADILIEALPYIKNFQHKIVVIKCGGRQLINEETINNILLDIVFMNCVGLNPVLVHGGGPSINDKMRASGRKVEFFQGQRVTDKETLAIVVEELNRLNTSLVQRLNRLETKAQGYTASTQLVVKAKQLTLQLGLVGTTERIETEIIKAALANNVVPVISPLGTNDQQQILNINADTAAADIAAGLGAWKLVLLTDVQGIMYDQNDEDSLISTLHVNDVSGLIKRNVIQQGMVPKVNACVLALEKGVKKTHIIDGGIPRSLLLEIFTDEGIGTQIVQ